MSSEYLIISCSLNPASKSRILAQGTMKELGSIAQVEWLDLRDYDLPICDGATAYGHKNVAILAEKIANAKCVLLAVPIYNYDVNAAAKNLIELTGRAWTEKVVGFICAAGGRASYMSVMSVANSLMLDFRCVVIPRFVYAEGTAFSGDDVSDEGVKARLKELAETAVKLTLSSSVKLQKV